VERALQDAKAEMASDFDVFRDLKTQRDSLRRIVITGAWVDEAAMPTGVIH